MEILVGIGALAGLTSVLLVSLLGQPRIFHAMAKDGLFPPFAAKLHPKFGTPYITTLITGISAGIMGAFLPIDILAELTSIGTLFAFAVVSIGVAILRIKKPNLPRGFKVPGGPYLIPFCGFASSVLLLVCASPQTLLRNFIWICIGLIFYACYGRRNSWMVKGEPHVIKTTSELQMKEMGKA